MFVKPKYIDIIDEIEDKLTDLDIYQYYIGKRIDRIPYKTNSPFHEDKHPSFGLYSRFNKILWKDFTLNKGGNVYAFVAELFGISYNLALIKIKKDMIDKNIMQLNRKIYSVKTDIVIKNESSNINIVPYYYEYNKEPKSYIEYWKQYKVISSDILKNNNVRCAKFVYMNDKLYCRHKDDDIVIIYKWKRKNNNKIYYKIYRPMNKEKKWLSNFRGSSKYLIHGLNKIDKDVNYVIITKSVKDKMVLEGLGYNAVNVQNEGISIPKEIINYLKSLYKQIYLLYDNDYNKSKNWGQIASRKIIKEYPFIKNIKINSRYRCTDISEFIMKFNELKTIKILNEQLKK